MTDDIACPICGSPTRHAFALTATYRTCTRNGHVFEPAPTEGA